jgi:hypothetical protein
MSSKQAVLVVFFISIAGLLFSGYLSYYELFVPAGCSAAIINCGSKPVNIANLPACVYGFLMYLVIFMVTGTSLLLYKNKK